MKVTQENYRRQFVAHNHALRFLLLTLAAACRTAAASGGKVPPVGPRCALCPNFVEKSCQFAEKVPSVHTIVELQLKRVRSK